MPGSAQGRSQPAVAGGNLSVANLAKGTGIKTGDDLTYLFFHTFISLKQRNLFSASHRLFLFISHSFFSPDCHLGKRRSCFVTFSLSLSLLNSLLNWPRRFFRVRWLFFFLLKLIDFLDPSFHLFPSIKTRPSLLLFWFPRLAGLDLLLRNPDF